MRRLFAQTRGWAALGALLLLALTAGSALANHATGRFTGWALIADDDVVYNLQVQPEEISESHRFTRVKIVGEDDDGDSFVICDEKGEFEFVTCRADRDDHESVWATVWYEDVDSKDDLGAIYDLGVLDVDDIVDSTNMFGVRHFEFPLTEDGADDNGNDNADNGNDNDND